MSVIFLLLFVSFLVREDLYDRPIGRGLPSAAQDLLMLITPFSLVHISDTPDVAIIPECNLS